MYASIELKDLLSLEFYKKSPYTGSAGVMRFRIEKIDVVIQEGEGDEPDQTERQLQATIWKGPLAFAHTQEEKTTHTAPFTNEGLEEICNWLNDTAKKMNPED